MGTSGGKFDKNGNRLPSHSDRYDTTLPFRAPDAAACNARLVRQGGYCTNPPGEGTNHPGYGRCRLHGGATPKQESDDGPLALWRAAGLEQIINMAETMSRDDAEYITYVSNNALVVTRAGIAAQLQQPNISAKEMADLTMALTRIDNILSKFPDEDNPEARAEFDKKESDAELRLRRLEQEYKSG